MNPYYTVKIPPVPPRFKTEWHSPNQSLTRGLFREYESAIEWARSHLEGTPYMVKYVDENGNFQDVLF